MFWMLSETMDSQPSLMYSLCASLPIFIAPCTFNCNRKKEKCFSRPDTLFTWRMLARRRAAAAGASLATARRGHTDAFLLYVRRGDQAFKPRGSALRTLRRFLLQACANEYLGSMSAFGTMKFINRHRYYLPWKTACFAGRRVIVS